MKSLINNKLSKCVLYIFLVLVFISCKNNKVQEPEFYNYKTKIEVKYTDNTKDTIFNSIRLHKNVRLSFSLKTSQPTFFGAEKIVAVI